MKRQSKIILLFTILFPVSVFATPKDSIVSAPQKDYRNVIKFNPTPMILWNSKNITFSYERTMNPRQTLSIELGYLVFSKFINDTLIKMVNVISNDMWGINASAEYRFYLTKLNVRPVPAGLYIGPYLTYYQFQFKNGLDFFTRTADTTGTIKGNLWSVNAGLELGYQFVFWKRWTLDLVMIGPSVSYYGGKIEVQANIDGSQLKSMNEDIYNKMVEKYPIVKNLSAGQTFQQTGKLDILRMGFRYLVQIGFRF